MNILSLSLSTLRSVLSARGGFAAAAAGVLLLASFAGSAEGKVVAWGYGGEGVAPVPPGALTGVKAIAAGSNHTLALKVDGSVVAWGRNVEGQTTVPAAALSGVTAVAAGYYHSVALTSAGKVISWGSSAGGQTYVPVAAQSGVVAIAGGAYHTMVLKDDGSVIVLGAQGQPVLTVPPAAKSGVIAIAAGFYSCVALKDDGSVVAWGQNDRGQTTVPAAALSGVTAICASDYATFAVKDGGVIAWGSNDYDETAIPLDAQSEVTTITAGRFHMFALKIDGTLVGWGYNAYGDLLPPASAQSGVLAVAAGGYNSVAIVGAIEVLPTLGAPTSAYISSYSATLGSDVAADGGAAIVERGVVFSLTSESATPSLGGAGVTKITDSGTTGVFTVLTWSLQPASRYSFRAYATNSEGTAYSSAATFRALPDTVITTIFSQVPTQNTGAEIMFNRGDSSPAEPLTFEGSLDGAVFATVTSPVTLTGLADGYRTYVVRAKDSDGNVDPAPAVLPWVVDTTPPETTITYGPVGRVASTSAAFAFGAGEAVSFTYVLDHGEPVAGLTGTVCHGLPPSFVFHGPTGSYAAVSFDGLALGTHTLRVFATDLAGNVDATPETRTWSIQIDPVVAVEFAKGSAVPGAGVEGSGVAAGAVFVSFGVPSINDAGDVAFLTKWSAPREKGVGIFAGSPAALVVKVGDEATGGATFATLKDPVLGDTGAVAFKATLVGPGVTTGNDTVLFTNAAPGGALRLVAREGAVVDGLNIKSIGSFSLRGAEVLYVATLAGGHPAVTEANNMAAYSVMAGMRRTVVRKGRLFGASPVKSFSLLAAVAGSPGQNRAHVAGSAAFLVLLADGTQALVDSAGGVLTAFAQTGGTTGSTALPGTTWKSFGPVAAPEGAFAAVAATLTPGVGGVTAANAKGIFVGNGTAFNPVARVGGPTGTGGAVFASFKDPVLAPETGAVAFRATIAGTRAVTTANDTALWWKPAGGALTRLAREGGHPEETEAGVTWLSFTSLAIAGGEYGAPIFVATLLQGKGGVKASNDTGLWAVDSNGALRLLAREGDTIEGKKLKTITALTAAPGAPGVTRSFNNARQVIYLATFTDASQAVITVQVP